MRVVVVPLLTVAALFGLSSPAYAWGHLFHVWPYDEMPVVFQVVTPPGGTYSGFTFDTLREANDRGFQIWEDVAQCADFRSELGPDITFDPANPPGYDNDRLNLVVFDDPRDELTEAGTLAAARTIPDRRNIERFINGRAYYPAIDGDIIYNNSVRYALNSDIEAGNCSGEVSLEAVATHEIGHIIGLAHSCERDDLCSNASLRDATMYWQADSCSTKFSIPNQDDIDGMTALYGPFATFDCNRKIDASDDASITFGVVPFELKCSVQSENLLEISKATWSWGDGTVDTYEVGPDGVVRGNTFDGSHTYTELGAYTIRVCFDGEREECGGWQFCFDRPAYVRACDVPQPVFQVEGVAGLRYQLLNETDLTVYGCVNDIQWDIFEGSEPSGEPIQSFSAWEPEVQFERVGTYTAVLNLGGPAGTAAAKATFDVRNIGDPNACSQVGGGAGGVGLLAGLLLLGRRRRQG